MTQLETSPQIQAAINESESPSGESDANPVITFPTPAALIAEVAGLVSPVWPLKDYVAVNPYAGLSGQRFIEARSYMKTFSECETLMPLSYYADQFGSGAFGENDIESAIVELGLHGSITTPQVTAIMHGNPDDASRDPRQFRTMAEHAEASDSTLWTHFIRDEIGKVCGAHYDQNQATWGSPWADQSLFTAWRETAMIDRTPEAFGLKNFRKFVASIPQPAEAAVPWLLKRLGVPEAQWKNFLLCQAYSIPGWSAWASHQTNWTTTEAKESNDFAALLAIRLTYDVMIAETFAMDYDLIAADNAGDVADFQAFDSVFADHTTARYILLRASELSFRDNLLESLSVGNPAGGTNEDTRKLSQMVFCIDVRSERIRRQLEKQSGKIETFGFAGFFGMPVEFIKSGEESGDAHLPVLLKPQYKLHEGIDGDGCCDGKTECESALASRRAEIRTWRKLWKKLQSSAVGCFPFVETTGFLFGWKLFSRAAGFASPATDGKFDGVADENLEAIGPTLRGLAEQGLDTAAQIDLAAGILTNLGLTKDFARLVVFCGHGSQTENNPLAAGLDCGACGGHSGEPNARMAAKLLNQEAIRKGLANRGIKIPEDTHFLAGLHNTTTDGIEFYDLHNLPRTHLGDLEQLTGYTEAASEQTVIERMPTVDSATSADVLRRSVDWSELRPEWGLAGNAAFIVGPRSLTKDANLNARSFLHSYDHTRDPEGKVLEGIMTAPMVVAHWINMQYFASTVDNKTFGSGNKTVHNVVGKFGILSGNGGDLQTGLPIQSLHTGKKHQHLPMRLQAVIAAPRQSIDRIVAAHANLADLLNNDWLHLVAIDEGQTYRYESGAWTAI